MRTFLLSLLMLVALNALAQPSTPSSANKEYEVTYLDRGKEYNPLRQAQLRQQNFWQNFISNNGAWYVHFDENSALPDRAYGKPIVVFGANPIEQAETFISNELSGFNIPVDELNFSSHRSTHKHHYVDYYQVHNGMKVLGSRLVIKLTHNGEVIMFGTDVYRNIELEGEAQIDVQSIAPNALEGLSGITISDINLDDEVFILPVPRSGIYSFHPVYEIVINGTHSNTPVKLRALIDANDGKLWYRTNEVKHIEGCDHSVPGNKINALNSTPPVQVSGSIVGTGYLSGPTGEQGILSMPNLALNIGGEQVYTDDLGFFQSDDNGPVSMSGSLAGLWTRIYSNGSTPNFSTTLSNGGGNDFNVDGFTNIRQRSAYHHVNQIHDYVNEVLPGFDGMDFQLPTNIDLFDPEGNFCNAFYDGSSINFYQVGNGCNPTSIIADVVYHEYGHGINDNFYSDNGSFFQNGAMNEGYADFWALSLQESDKLAIGFYIDNDDPLRRYDQDPMVFPENIVGQVHNDGEIICGAWITTHYLLGGDWNLTRTLFSEAFVGLQAAESNGNEGVAFTNVLIDVLQADDDDNDITNGTPNGDEIIEGFAVHGITLISNASLTHSPEDFAEIQDPIDLDVELNLAFPFSQYLDNPVLFWRLSGESEWQEVEMESQGNDLYSGNIPGQEAGTVIAYCVGARDQNDAVSNVLPLGARSEDPNVPYFILVGVELVAQHDNDLFEDFGTWETGIPGDNATTGEWEQNFPIGSFNDDGTEVAPSQQYMPGDDAEYCFLTGQSSSPDAPIGENDIDDGKTTLQSPLMDLSEYADPIFTYRRWYTNSPPSGANPNADWWEVRLSEDGGNSWINVEATKTSDASWRKVAFKVKDYAENLNQLMLQFIASDSIRPGQNLEGGSLVEAALDNIYLYDATISNSIAELDGFSDLNIWPNPASDHIILQYSLELSSKVSFEILSPSGRSVYLRDESILPRGEHISSIPVESLSTGLYFVKIISEQGEMIKKILIE